MESFFVIKILDLLYQTFKIVVITRKKYMNKLKKMQAEVLSQMTVSEEISENFSAGLKNKINKVGVMAVLAATAFLSSGLAHANDSTGDKALRATVGLNAVTGILVDGSKPSDIPADCNVQGTNGWKVGGGSAAGAYAFNQFGKGNGRAISTVAGALLVGSVVQSRENERIRQDCLKQIQQRQATQYNNPNRGYSPQPTGYNAPQYGYNNAMPTAPILYQGRNTQGLPYYVTVEDSPGLAALQGTRVGNLDVNGDPIVKGALDRSAHGLQDAYAKLDEAAQKYLQVANGRSSSGKLSRYAVSDEDVRAGANVIAQQQNNITTAKSQFEAAYTNYATKRAIFANIADNAAVDNYNIVNYADNLNYMMPPESASLTYNGKLPNRYANLPNAVRP